MEVLFRSGQRWFQWADALIPEVLAMQPDKRRKARGMIIAYFLTGIFLVAFACLYHLVDFRLGVGMSIYGAVIIPILLLVFRGTGNFILTGVIFDVNAVILFAVLIYGSGGLHSSIVPWLAIVPASGFAFSGLKRGGIMAGIALLGIISLAVMENSGTVFQIAYNAEYEVELDMAVNLGLVLYFGMILFSYEMGKGKYWEKMRRMEVRLEVQADEIKEQQDALAYSHDRISNLNGEWERKLERKSRLREQEERQSVQLWDVSINALRAKLVQVQGILALRSEREALPEVVQAQLEKALLGNAGEMDALLHKLMIWVQLQHRPRKNERVCFRELLDQEVGRQAGKIQAHGIRIDVHSTADAFMFTDGELLRWIVACLLENAIAFSSRTGRVPLIRLDAQAHRGHFQLVMTDNGIGIGPALLPKVSEMFVQGKERRSGSGLGLFLVDKMVEQLGGTWQIQSEKSKWTTVALRIPLGAWPIERQHARKETNYGIGRVQQIRRAEVGEMGEIDPGSRHPNLRFRVPRTRQAP